MATTPQQAGVTLTTEDRNVIINALGQLQQTLNRAAKKERDAGREEMAQAIKNEMARVLNVLNKVQLYIK